MSYNDLTYLLDMSVKEKKKELVEGFESEDVKGVESDNRIRPPPLSPIEEELREKEGFGFVNNVGYIQLFLLLLIVLLLIN